MTKCECGCGGEAKPRRRFISGHNTRLRTSSERIEIGKKTSITYRVNREIKEGKRPAPKPTLCKCGCSGLCKIGNTYIHGHQSKGVPKSDTHKKHLSESKKGKKLSKNHCKKISEGYVKYHQDHPKAREQFIEMISGDNSPMKRPEVAAKVSEFMKKNNPMNNPESRKKVGDSKRGKPLSEETCQKMSISHTGVKRTPHTEKAKEKMSNIRKGKTKENSESVRRQAQKMTGRTKENNEGKRRGAEKMKKIIKTLWQDPKFVRKMINSFNIKPNKPEKLIYSLLQNILPNEYTLNVKGHLIIDGKIPDFVNINGQKKLIEFNGCYFHECPICYPKKGDKGLIETEKRIELFKKYGWNTLVIWEHELEDMKEVINKILGFHDIKSLSCTKQLTID